MQAELYPLYHKHNSRLGIGVHLWKWRCPENGLTVCVLDETTPLETTHTVYEEANMAVEIAVSAYRRLEAKYTLTPQEG
jgi:hypothetical protein